MGAGTYILRRFGIGRSRPEKQAITGDGAITIIDGYVVLSKASAAAITLADPTTNQDGMTLEIFTRTAQAHVITAGTSGFNGKGASGTATFAAAKGNGVILRADGGSWWVIGNIGVTIA